MLGNNFRKYMQPEDDDSIYLQEFGQVRKILPSNSSYLLKTPRYSLDIKKRANEIEKEEKKQE